MKKGLSVLLIAAALFGFYGGATNLNDVLACKDYFTSASGASDDMQRLEDGLNQLKDNEKAYLDGVQQVADGEVTLAEGKAALAEGEAALADGAAKLADGRKQLANGEKDLAAAIASRAKLKKVKNKLAQVEPAYKPWYNKFNKLRDSIIDDAENPTKGVLYDAGAVGVGLSTLVSSFATVKTKGEDGLETVRTLAIGGVKANIAAQYKQQHSDCTDEEAAAYADTAWDSMSEEAQEGAINQAIEGNAQLKAGQAKAQGFLAVYNVLSTKYQDKMLGIAKNMGDITDKVSKATYPATTLRKSDVKGNAKDAEDLLNEMLEEPYIAGAIAQYPEDTAALAGGVKQVIGLAQASQSSKKTYDKNYDELKPSASLAKGIAKKVSAAAKAVLSNKDMLGALTSEQKATLKPYRNTKALTDLNVEYFYATMSTGEDMKEDGKGSLLDNYNKLLKGAKDGLGKYNDGIADGSGKLAKGRKDLAKGEADYAEGAQQLADGRAQLADGEKQLEDGKAQLAQYEDGEQQVRDGLATLVGTDAMGNVQSIADRIGNDTDFDNGDTHLELDEGLSAVQAGKGYAADLTAAVTDEIMGRAVGTGLLIGAGVLAVLAALLSFLKKNKGAGVFAILAAAAGCVGAVMGNNAGMQFSSIAGSTMGATPWIAAGILAAVAAVHAVVHFAAKKAA